MSETKIKMIIILLPSYHSAEKDILLLQYAATNYHQESTTFGILEANWKSYKNVAKNLSITSFFLSGRFIVGKSFLLRII